MDDEIVHERPLGHLTLDSDDADQFFLRGIMCFIVISQKDPMRDCLPIMYQSAQNFELENKSQVQHVGQKKIARAAQS